MQKREPKLVSRSNYLSNPIVCRFVNYLTDLLDGKSISHEILIRDRRLPPSDERRTNPRFAIKSMEEAFSGYWWNRDGYDANTKTINEIQLAVKNSINMERLPEANLSSLEVLKQVLNWGAGGTGQKLYTNNLEWSQNNLGTLSESLRLGRIAMSSDFPDLSVFKPKRSSAYARMNAGFTKYYALACDDVIIYDGRVGAAMGFLVRSFCIENKITTTPQELAFRWGPQTGTNPLNRNPSQDQITFQKLPAEGPIWAECNIKANWVLKAARESTLATWCTKDDGLRRIEAALFVIGYSMKANVNQA